MLIVAVLINNKLIAKGTAQRISEKNGIGKYLLHDGIKIVHSKSQGAHVLAQRVLGRMSIPTIEEYYWKIAEKILAETKENKMDQKPSIGRIVHYQRYGTPGGEHKAEPSPAIITKVEADGSTCQLFVMNPNGTYHNPTPYSPEPKPGHWNWPPRV